MNYLVTSADGRYWDRIRPYLATLKRLNEGITPVVMAVESTPPDWIAEMDYLTVIPISHADNEGTSESTSVEHGSFLRFLPDGDGDDLIIYTNGDMVLQRSLNATEMHALDCLPQGHCFATWNNGPGDNLLDEATRLRPRYKMDQVTDVFSDIEQAPCFNMGVFMARRKTYQELYAEYMENWNTVDTVFSHYARQQWGVCYAAWLLGLDWQQMTPAWHTHFHYGVPDGVSRDGETIMYQDMPVLWTHKHERLA